MSTLQAPPLNRPSPWVRQIETPDGAALLDIRRGLCLSLTPVGAQIWRRLRSGDSITCIVDILSSEYDVARDQIYEDIKQFITTLFDQELLVGSSFTCENTPPGFLRFALTRYRQFVEVGSRMKLTFSAVRMWQALGLLVLYDMTRLHTQFAVMLRVLQEWPVHVSSKQPEPTAQICNSLDHACILYPKQVLCLQRSFVLTCMLRSYGMPATMVIGAQKLPFQAHAWTEINHRPINESRDVESRYLVWGRW